MFKSVVSTILFCGQRNLPLRGHRDDSDLQSIGTDDGLFRNLLRFRIDAGDKKLESLISGPRNARYTSKTVQNDVIDVIGDEILSKIVSQIKESVFFTIMMDETPSSARKEEVALVIRFVSLDGCVSEKFVGFKEAKNTTGAALASLLVNALEELGLSIEYCRGQSYDGAAAMSGKYNGVQAHIRKLQPLAEYMHCVNHALNLVVAKACKSGAFKNTFGIINAVSDFFLVVSSASKTPGEFGG